MTHECRDCTNAVRLNMEQIDRFTKSGMDATTFINQPYEEEMSALMNKLARRCALRKQADAMFPSPK